MKGNIRLIIGHALALGSRGFIFQILFYYVALSFQDLKLVTDPGKFVYGRTDLLSELAAFEGANGMGSVEDARVCPQIFRLKVL